MKNPHTALTAIEYLVGADLGLDLEWWLTSRVRKFDIDLLERAAKVVDKIYMIAHSEGRCEHPSWEKIKDEVIAAYHKPYEKPVNPKSRKRKHK